MFPGQQRNSVVVPRGIELITQETVSSWFKANRAISWVQNRPPSRSRGAFSPGEGGEATLLACVWPENPADLVSQDQSMGFQGDEAAVVAAIRPLGAPETRGKTSASINSQIVGIVSHCHPISGLQMLENLTTD